MDSQREKTRARVSKCRALAREREATYRRIHVPQTETLSMYQYFQIFLF